MTEDDPPSDRHDSLRERAEAVASARADGELGDREPIEELRLHQIELELQNEELRATQAALIEARDRYARLYENAPVGYATTSDDGVIVMANATLVDMLGLERDAVAGVAMSSLILPEDQDTWYHHQRRCTRDQPRSTCELSLRGRRDGPIRARVESVCVHDEAGRRLLQSSISDISELQRAQSEHRRLEVRVREAQHMESLGLLAGGIAHDFNNMLTILIGRAELALMFMGPDSPARDHVQHMLVAGERAAGMVSQILSFSRREPLDCTIVSLGPVVQEALDLLRTMKPEGVALRSEIAQDVPAVLADATQIEQVLLNLCTNAFRAMRETGGVLTVTVEPETLTARAAQAHPAARPGEYARLVVHDTGHGIPSEVLERIFEPFFTTQPTGEGTGMGLAMSHGIVASHGGFITVDSTIGVGTEFCVHLPVPHGAHERAPSSHAGEPTHGSERILVVEDQRPVLDMVSHMLESLGYRVTPSSSGAEAIAALERSPDDWDLILTDQTMPGVDGLDVLKASRTLRSSRPVVIMTGHRDELTETEDGGVGADAIIYKPFRRAQIGQLLRRILDDRPSIEEP